METFAAVFHIVICVVLVALVLVQDSKSGSLGGAFGGGSSNSVWGPLGAATLAQKLTRWIAVAFAISCVYLSISATRQSKSIIDSVPQVSAPTAPTAPAPVTAPESAQPAPSETPGK
jgi:preprotein translocase subunit SecG